MEHLSVSANMENVDEVSDTASDVCDEFRQEFINLADKIESVLPDSRPRALALTNLETALMWAINATVHTPENELG